MRGRLGPVAIAALAGGIAPLGWAPLAWWPLALAAYAVLFAALARTRSVTAAGAVGAAFGAAFHLAGHGWVFASLHGQAGMGLLAAATSTAVFAAYLALFTAVPCAVWRVLAPARQPDDFIAWRSWAALMTLGEVARGIPFHGFTSLSLGYALIDTWLSGHAPVFGVYALSLIGYGMAGSLASATTDRRLRHPLGWIAGVGAAFAIGAVAQGIQWVRPVGDALSFRLIQGHVAQQRKFDSIYLGEQSRRYVSLIRARPADVIATPETAFPLPLNEFSPQTLNDLQTFARESGSHLFLGVPTIDANAQGHNSMVHVAPTNSLLQKYDKVQLMPFGEYGPAGFGWFTDDLHIALKDLAPGAEDQQPFNVRGQAVGTLICQEDLGSARARRWLSVEPAVAMFLNPSNLAWFEDSAAIAQRQQIVRMRALEVGRPILRVANTGITAVIDHRGVVSSALPASEPGVLSGIVLGRQGLTPFARWGDAPVGALCLVIVAACAARTLRQTSAAH